MNDISNSIMVFLTQQCFVRTEKDIVGNNPIVYFTKRDSYFTTYEFVFISDKMYINKYFSEDSVWRNKPNESLSVNPCDINTFANFYFNMIKIK